MRKLLRVLLVALFITGLSGCIHSDFEEVTEEGIEVPLSTDSDDDDEIDHPGEYPGGSGN